METWMNDRYISKTITIRMRDGHVNEARIFSPSKKPAIGSPLVVLVHAGGFAMGTTHQMASFAQGYSTLFGAKVVNVTHRLAPEHVFPTAAHDVWDAFEWLADNADVVGADVDTGFILGGVSSGANLAAVTAQRATETSFSPRLTGVWMCMPCVLDKNIVPEEFKEVFISREQAAKALLVDTANLYSVIESSKPDVHSPDWSPFNSTKAHIDMPPCYIQVSGADPMRDDGLIYERALRSVGVKTKLDVYPGVPHWHFGFFPSLQASKKANADAMYGGAWLLDAKVDDGIDVLEAMGPPI